MNNTEDVVVYSTETEQEDAFANYRHDIVTKVAYLLGIQDEVLNDDKWFDLITYELTKKDEKAQIIRSLCIIRNQFLRNYSALTQARSYSFKPLEEMHDLLDTDSILFLRAKGIEVAHVNTNSSNVTVNIAYINQYILDNIDKVKPLFPDWVKFDYIRRLFLMSGGYAGNNGSTIKQKSGLQSVTKKIHMARSAYMEQRNLYPFRTYVNWPYMFRETDGNILFNDAKFLKMLYAANGDMFMATEYVIDAKTKDKETVYDFLDEAINVTVFVDCENVDPFHFAATILNLDENNLSKIKKIILYDDVNASSAWGYLASTVKIPIERKEINRLLENKSLVDITLTMGVCEEFYKNNTESIVLVSSDSDFWGVISNLAAAKFFVLNERDKTSYTIISKLNEKGIRHCYMDDFAMDKVQAFKTAVLYKQLMQRINHFNETGCFEELDAEDLVHTIFQEARVTGGSTQIQKEKDEFFKKYLKDGLVVKPVEQDGRMIFKMEINRK